MIIAVILLMIISTLATVAVGLLYGCWWLSRVWRYRVAMVEAPVENGSSYSVSHCRSKSVCTVPSRTRQGDPRSGASNIGSGCARCAGTSIVVSDATRNNRAYAGEKRIELH